MKVLLAALTLPLVLAYTASADWVIESKIESPQLNSNTVTKVKGSKMRVDIPSSPMGAMSSIIDSNSGDTLQLVHAQKMAVKTTAAQMKQAMEMAMNAAGKKPDATAPPVKPTGEKEKVGDFDCDIYSWTDGTTTVKLWVAKNHPNAAGLKALEQQMKKGVLGSLQQGPDTTTLPGPAIKTEINSGGTKTVTTVVSVKEENVDAKEFDLPAGYQSMAMPGAPGAQ